MAWRTLREVVEEVDVSEYVDLLLEKYPRFDEAWDALKWLLARNPEPKGSALKVTDGRRYRAYVLAGDLLAGTPEIWVVYTVTESQIGILGVTAKDVPAEAVDEE